MRDPDLALHLGRPRKRWADSIKKWAILIFDKLPCDKMKSYGRGKLETLDTFYTFCTKSRLRTEYESPIIRLRLRLGLSFDFRETKL